MMSMEREREKEREKVREKVRERERERERETPNRGCIETFIHIVEAGAELDENSRINFFPSPRF